MSIPDKPKWPVIPREIPDKYRRYFTIFQESVEEYLRELQRQIHEITFYDEGLQQRWADITNGDARIVYDFDGSLQFFVGDTKVMWFDWHGNLHTTVAWDQISTNLTKTSNRNLIEYDPSIPSIDVFHAGNQILQISTTGIIVDNAHNVNTGQTLSGHASMKIVDEDSATGATFISVKEHRVLQISGMTISLKGAMKIVS